MTIGDEAGGARMGLKNRVKRSWEFETSSLRDIPQRGIQQGTPARAGDIVLKFDGVDPEDVHLENKHLKLIRSMAAGFLDDDDGSDSFGLHMNLDSRVVKLKISKGLRGNIDVVVSRD